MPKSCDWRDPLLEHGLLLYSWKIIHALNFGQHRAFSNFPVFQKERTGVLTGFDEKEDIESGNF